MQEITLAQMLEARENRVHKQEELIKKYKSTLICFTMNVPGPVKKTSLIERGFNEGCRSIESRLGQEIIYKEIKYEDTGCEAYYIVETDALQVKRICVDIEDETSIGRLYDMDVIGVDGCKLDRESVNGKSRDCIVCGAKGRGCASRRLHSVAELQNSMNDIMKKYFAEKDREIIARYAYQSLIDEVLTTPKPGLVDCNNQGSHKDMDVETFYKSAEALRPFFAQCVRIGQENQDKAPEEIFSLLKQEGIRAEKAMYQATGGVNTHKGAIYSIGVLCGTVGMLWKPEQPFQTTDEILNSCKDLTRTSVEKDFVQIEKKEEASTAGERIYLKYGLKGIRGEVADGFPSIRNIGIPVFKKCLEDGLEYNEAGCVTLLHFIGQVKDTNIHHRGGMEGSQYAMEEAKCLLAQTQYPTKEEIMELDNKFIEKNISPGGCADLLAVIYFLHRIDEENCQN